MVGGFIDKTVNFEFEHTYKIVILPEQLTVDLPNPSLPYQVRLSVDAIIAADSASKKATSDAFVLTMDLKESKYAKDLPQINSNIRISRGNLKCENCDLKQNLWLNLTDGSINCGREVYGGGGGNGHALAHYNKTGYPLVVKLGTITPEGKADVYSYAEDENDMVLDPYLDKHLKHFGIDMAELKKTEKSTDELQLEYQYALDMSRIGTETNIKRRYGPGYTGIENMGNSCYLASILQVLNTIPEFVDRYYNQRMHLFSTAKKDAPNDFLVQMAKLSDGLLSGDYSHHVEIPKDAPFIPFTGNGIRPEMLKAIVGKGHPEFSTNRQQDALELFQYLLTLIERSEHAHGEGQDPGKVFSFKFIDRMQCTTSKNVRYSDRLDNVVSLPIPIEKAVNLAEYNAYMEEEAKKTEEQKKLDRENKKEVIRPAVKLTDCLIQLCSPEDIDGFYSSAIKDKTIGIKTTQFGTMPKYLMVQVRKFKLDSGWVPMKMDVDIIAPDELDLEPFRSHGLQPGEVELPTEDSPEPVIPWDEEVVSQLVAMDIPLVRAQRASVATKSDANAAMEWLFSNIDDPSLDTPIELKATNKPSTGQEPDEGIISMVMDLGFPREKAIAALKKTDMNAERAVDWLFSHGDSMDLEEDESSNPVAPKELDDGVGHYELKAFVTHIGSSTISGHYVCHIKKDDTWILYNDEDVAVSSEVPREMAYLYLYKRK